MYIQGKYLLAGLHDISECIAIRKEVFGEEQKFASAAAEDADDKEAIFVLAYETVGDTLVPVGTGRLLFLGERYKIGRIAVKKEYRGKKYGDFIVRMLIDKAFTMGAEEVYVGAQKYAIPFYETIGFIPVGETYEEDGIFHQMMKIMPCTCKKECGH